MKRVLLILAVVFVQQAQSQNESNGLRGEPAAIADAREMVTALGGLEIWAKMKSLRFVHEWYFWNRLDSYVEDEVLDLTGPRSWVEMKSEIYHRLRAYSPEHKYWNIMDGEFAFANESAFESAMERAPYHWVRIAHAIAVNDPFYEIRFGPGPFTNSRQLEFFGPDGQKHGSILLNVRKEPVVWSTTQYTYTFGPMKRFGNLRVPDWASTGNGAVTYQMISLTGSSMPPDSSLFVPPVKFQKQGK